MGEQNKFKIQNVQMFSNTLLVQLKYYSDLGFTESEFNFNRKWIQAL